MHIGNNAANGTWSEYSYSINDKETSTPLHTIYQYIWSSRRVNLELFVVTTRRREMSMANRKNAEKLY